MKRHSITVACTLGLSALLLLFLSSAPALGEPPSERTLVHAVADADQPRILIRWLQVEGVQTRYAYYDVLRRDANALTFSQINPDPIGPLATLEEIEQVFTAPGNVDALDGILQSLGPDYASDLLSMQGAGPASTLHAQHTLLPDLNYGAAIALGLGYMDDTVTPGASYVYEVWGLDSLGFRVERLGQVSATEGVPPTLPAPQNPECVDLGDERADLAAFVRWEELAASSESYVVGYDLFRARRNPDTTCPTVQPGQPGVFKANTYPTFASAPGSPALGQSLFTTHCASCHGLGRSAAPVAGSTLAEYRRLVYPELYSSPSEAEHSGLSGLGEDTLKAIYDWIGEFHYREGVDATHVDPLERQTTYCYKVFPRDLLGQYGSASIDLQCEVLDRVAPAVPGAVRTERIVQTDMETCQVSWDRNAATDDDTVAYYLYRADEVPRLAFQGPDVGDFLTGIPQPVAGSRVTYLDATIDIADAGESFFYALRSEDDAGNLSDLSGWAPCVPRDIVPPPPATLSVNCAECPLPEHCRWLGDDPDWVAAGGDPDLWYADPDFCFPFLNADFPGDTFGHRPLRSYSGAADSFLPGPDFKGTLTLDLQPMIDEIVYTKIQAFDKSGNLAPASNPITFLLFGMKLPAPQIIYATELTPAGRIKIRFRSLQPDRLLGFALYKEYKGPGDDAPTGQELVVRYDDTSLGDEVPPGSGWWARKSGAVTLDKLSGFIRTTDPAGPAFLYYNDLDQYYVLQADVGALEDLVLRVRAIGKTGKEGLDYPFAWDPSTPADTVLEWPRIRDVNRGAGSPPLAVTYLSGPPRMQLEWNVAPNGCDGFPDFIVFRRRGSATRWQQISPPFRCNDSAPTPEDLAFTDTDVQPGFSYSYTVIRLHDDGEFSHRYGPTTATATP